MEKKNQKKQYSTNDVVIRKALKNRLENEHSGDKRLRIVDELGVHHGIARVDLAVVNGIMHGYEIKSDLDTLKRLPEQMNVFNSVFDKMTLVVGKNHLHEAIKIIPEWWEIIIAKVDENGSITFNKIRDGEYNKNQDTVSIAKLLWREEALKILENEGEAIGLYSKSRDLIYNRLASVFNKNTLSDKVRETLFFRTDWRLDSPLVLNGD